MSNILEKIIDETKPFLNKLVVIKPFNPNIDTKYIYHGLSSDERDLYYILTDNNNKTIHMTCVAGIELAEDQSDISLYPTVPKFQLKLLSLSETIIDLQNFLVRLLQVRTESSKPKSDYEHYLIEHLNNLQLILKFNTDERLVKNNYIVYDDETSKTSIYHYTEDLEQIELFTPENKGFYKLNPFIDNDI